MDTSGRDLALWLAVGVLALGSLVTGAAAAEAGEPVFRAGAAASLITPPLGVDIVGNWETPKATHVHDDLHARCLVLDDGERRLAIVICDNLAIDRQVFDRAKSRLHAETGIPPEQMLMASTHTHSGPPARRYNSVEPYEDLTEYQILVADRIVEGVQRAVGNLEPAQIGWGRGSEPSQVFNRRWHMSDPTLMVSPFGHQDQVRMNPPGNHPALVKPAGPTDPGITFLSVRAVDGRPIALLANYSLHYVGGVPSGHISADYFGAFAKRIEELLGASDLEPPFVGILSNGTSGDINNIDFLQARPKREPYEQIQHVSNLVATEVHRVYETIEHHEHARLDARMSKLTLAVRKPDEATLEWARGVREKPDSETELRERLYAGRMISMRNSPDTVDIWVQTLRIGDVGIAGIPFETFAETGLNLKQQGPLPVTFTISFANGGYGYLPTPAQHELGGYETWQGTSRVAAESEPAIVAALLGQFAELSKE